VLSLQEKIDTRIQSEQIKKQEIERLVLWIYSKKRESFANTFFFFFFWLPKWGGGKKQQQQEPHRWEERKKKLKGGSR
jgi:hypothetical protein